MGILISFLAAFLLGFIAHRAGLCTIKAVAEVFTSGHSYILASFLKTTIWVVALSFLGLVLFDISTSFNHWPVTAYSIGGGLLVGVAAVANGGCAFSTLTRLGDGDVNFAATVIGWPAGAWIEKILVSKISAAPLRTGSIELINTPLLYVAIIAAVTWLIWQMIVITRPFPRRKQIAKILLSPQYKLSAAAVLIALCNLVLFDNLGPWSFTSVALSTAAPLHFPAASALPLLWLVLGFTIAGIVVSSMHRKSFSLQKPNPGRLAMHGAAGIAMGFGAAMIPGGNDSLVLYGMSSFSPHAIPAYIAILTGIALAFLFMKKIGGAPPAVYCVGDICVTSTEPTAADLKE